MRERNLSTHSFRNGSERIQTGNNFGSAAGPVAMPTDIELKKTNEELDAVIGSISPVFFSTLEDGRYVLAWLKEHSWRNQNSIVYPPNVFHIKVFHCSALSVS